MNYDEDRVDEYRQKYLPFHINACELVLDPDSDVRELITLLAMADDISKRVNDEIKSRLGTTEEIR